MNFAHFESKEFQLKTAIFHIGRDPDCEIPIADDTISRFHAEVQLTDDGRLFVIDTNSSNGTFLIREGVKERITQATADVGDSISFGDCCFEVSDLIADIRSRSRHRSQGSAGNHPSEPSSEFKRVRCTVCGYVKLEGEPCPRCAK